MFFFTIKSEWHNFIRFLQHPLFPISEHVRGHTASISKSCVFSHLFCQPLMDLSPFPIYLLPCSGFLHSCLSELHETQVSSFPHGLIQLYQGCPLPLGLVSDSFESCMAHFPSDALSNLSRYISCSSLLFPQGYLIFLTICLSLDFFCFGLTYLQI